MVQRKADPKAVAVARAVQDTVPEDTVIVLFGSRARGDHNRRSDIDLMVLEPDGSASHPDTIAATSRAAHALAEKEYGHAVPVDILHLDHPRFRRGRRAVNHVAYDVTRDGIPMTRIPHDAINPDASDDGYPDNWPDISERLRDALDSFRSMRHDLADGAEKYMGRHGQETLEHCYKALLSTLGIAYPRTHNLRELEALLERHSEHHGLHIPPSPDWLANFYGGGRYSSPAPITVPPQELFEQIERVKDAIIARVYQVTGTTGADLYP